MKIWQNILFIRLNFLEIANMDKHHAFSSKENVPKYLVNIQNGDGQMKLIVT